MKHHFQLLSIAFSIGALLLFTGCSKDEGINPGELSITERGFTPYFTFSASLIGLSPDNTLIKFNTARPNAQTVVSITGIALGENILAIDMQPGTSNLFGVSSNSLLYQIDSRTGMATLISTRSFDPLLEGSMTGFDFNTADSSLWVVTDADQNLRISPLTGDVIGVGVPISPDSLSISGIAFSPAYSDAHPATMYDIDEATSMLYRQNYSSGMVSRIGPLGVTVLSEVGFDISSKGYGFAIFDGQGVQGGPTSPVTDLSQAGYRVWLVNLGNGMVRPLADVSPMIGLTAL